MDNVVCMAVVESFKETFSNEHSVFLRVDALAFKSLEEFSASKIFHDQMDASLALINFIEFDDVRMAESSQDRDFAT